MSRIRNSICARLIIAACCALPASAQWHDQQSDQYLVETDVDTDTAREAQLRLDKIVAEYQSVLGDSAKKITTRSHVRLYKTIDAYFKDGGLSGTAGVFLPRDPDPVLLVYVGERPTFSTWHSLQHEAFHQFLFRSGLKLPVWMNEGLAEYFGEFIFTGDSYTDGLIPPWRLKRLEEEINTDQLQPFEKFMNQSHDQWTDDIQIRNYDQAWSLMHFILHAEKSKHRPQLTDYLIRISNGETFAKAWPAAFGNANDLEKSWRTYWLKQEENATSRTYAKATVAILTSFLARATAMGQHFTSYDDFATKAEQGQLKISETDWLPKRLLKEAQQAARGGKWELNNSTTQPSVVVMLGQSQYLRGEFELDGQRVKRVSVRTIP